MKKIVLSVVMLVAMHLSVWGQASEKKQVSISVATEQCEIRLMVSPAGRLYQVYLGKPLLFDEEVKNLSWYAYAGSDGSIARRGYEVYPGSGGEDYFEPALAVTHADGNRTTYLYYKNHIQRAIEGGEETVIELSDQEYAVNVTLYYRAYAKENVIKTWAEISHQEPKPITLWRYASTLLYLNANRYFVTNYHSDWAREGQPECRELSTGKYIVDTKLGTRAAIHAEPFFELGLDGVPHETMGDVMLGTIGWTGNFSITFEVDNTNTLRLIPAINPYSSDYLLPAGEVFRTPEFIFTLSGEGTSQASRNLHDWARRYQLKDGMGNRMTLLNNWESTGFGFDEEKLAAVIGDTRQMGADMFLLDDGWFGNKHPRNNPTAGLGDWEENRRKLPNGVGFLTETAKKEGVKFGLWIEPEMVNPRSELMEKHPEWVITQANRKPYYYRWQLVLDLPNPQVQDYVFGVVDGLMQKYPDIAYFKWDCNSTITNIHSPYLKEKQGQLYIDYTRGLYNVLNRISDKYPTLPMMLCSGGGGRCDYEALKYFTEFWCSDNTDPYERLYIQWSMSKFFPTKAMAAHVTHWNRAVDLKFAIDVASMCKLGFDIDYSKLSDDEKAFCQVAIKNYNSLKPIILDGDQYRLVSPYETNHAAVAYVNKAKDRAVLFAYDLHPRYQEPVAKVKFQGLAADKMYRLTEVNLRTPKSSLKADSKVYSGDFLMKVGIDVFSYQDGVSHVVELVAI
ncbi:MAG: alpha-galactosidase [Mediterranea massiliensis]|nr:alpha-galactosidase [Mediterranea massiliensis]